MGGGNNNNCTTHTKAIEDRFVLFSYILCPASALSGVFVGQLYPTYRLNSAFQYLGIQAFYSTAVSKVFETSHACPILRDTGKEGVGVCSNMIPNAHRTVYTSMSWRASRIILSAVGIEKQRGEVNLPRDIQLGSNKAGIQSCSFL